MMPKIFRENPPIDIINEVLACSGLRGINDSTAFSRGSIHVEVMESILPELEPYYVPCKADVYIIPPLTQARGIVIIRQLLKNAKIHLISEERSTNSVKEIWYYIEKSSVLPCEVVMDFN